MATIYFVTNRNPLPENQEPPATFGTSFNPAALTSVRYGRAEIKDVTPAGKPLATVYDRNFLIEQIDAFREDIDADPPILGSTPFLESLRGAMYGEKGCDTLAYVHGFDNTFEEALVAGAQLKHVVEHAPNAQGPVNLVVFTWPSYGKVTPVIGHPRDRNHASASGDAMARGIMKLYDFAKALPEGARCHRSIHLLAHSMGNYALRHAVQGLRRLYERDRLPRIFDKVLLMAADEDNDAFEHVDKLALLPDLAYHVSVYYNREDLPLVISDRTKGQPDRLGSDGPRQPWSIPGKVSLVDCSTVVTGVQEHHYYLNNDVAILDMVEVLKGTRPDAFPANRRRYSTETNSYQLLPPGAEVPSRRHRPNATLRAAER